MPYIESLSYVLSPSSHQTENNPVHWHLGIWELHVVEAERRGLELVDGWEPKIFRLVRAT